MRIVTVELRRVSMPLVEQFRSSLSAESVREAIIVRIDSDVGRGWGECVAGSDPLYSPEYIDATWLSLVRYLIPRLLAEPRLGARDVSRLLAPYKGQRMAKAALEMAVLDAELSAEGVSLSAFLGGTTPWVTPGVAVGISGSIPHLLESVAFYLEQGYARVKLKIEPGWDLEPVRAVRERFGPQLALQVDANGSYGRADFDHLAQLDQFSLVLIEQPLDEEDLVGHARLAAQLVTPLCLDESIVSAASAATALSLGACAVINIKAGRVGGYLEARAIHDLCFSGSIPVWCGGMLETGIGRAANLALASLAGFSLPGDISASDRYFHEDITAPFVMENGRIAVPAGPGLGVEVLMAALDRFTTQSETIRSTTS